MNRKTSSAAGLGVLATIVLIAQLWGYKNATGIGQLLPQSWWFVGPFVGIIGGLLVVGAISEWKGWRFARWLDTSRDSPDKKNPHFARRHRNRSRRLGRRDRRRRH